MNEPIKHHYIPQFILRNFNKEGNRVCYWNIENNKLEERSTSSIFMEKNLYRNNDYSDEPTKIERKFSQLENEISQLIKNNILNREVITLTRAEAFKLRNFLFLMSFRIRARMQQYRDQNFTPDTKEYLSSYVKNENYEKLWLEELNNILDAKSIENVLNADADSIMKEQAFSFKSFYYLTFVKTKEQNFLLGDVYPTAEIDISLINDSPEKTFLHFLYPITPNLMIILNNVIFKKQYEAINKSMKDIVDIDTIIMRSKIKGNCIFEPIPHYAKPNQYSLDDIFEYHLKQIKNSEVLYINSLILNEAKKGIIFKNKYGIYDSIKYYEALLNIQNSRKNDYRPLLLEILDKNQKNK